MAPPAKPEGTRRRRNRTSTAATLRAASDPVVPELPARATPWHPMTLSWWADTWRSPMAPEFVAADLHGLFQLARLVDMFWQAETPNQAKELSAEIRHQGSRFGLSPLDRRRLQWEVERTEDAQDRGARRRASSLTETEPKPRRRKDPRAGLQIV